MPETRTDVFSNDEGNILFCANDTYAQHMAACIISLLENSSLSFHNIVIAGRFSSPETASKLMSLVDGNKKASIKIVNFEPPDEVELPTRIHYTTDIYTRLWVSDFFPSDVNRVVYLDSDMIVTGDIADLWRTDLSGKMIAAVDIPGSTRNQKLGIDDAYNYFNSGVLLFDLDIWRQQKAFTTIISYIQSNIDKLIDPDQDALNACFFKQRHTLDLRWNVIAPFTWTNNELDYSLEQCVEIVQNANIVHFNGQSKPWHFLNTHPRKQDYWKYVKMSPWCDAKEEGRSFIGYIKKMYNYIVLPGPISVADAKRPNTDLPSS